ncbi:MAG: response regulator [Terriglobales bacterium]
MLSETQTVAHQVQRAAPIDGCENLSLPQETILVVEDDPFVRDAACDILENEGYRVLRARNAAEAQSAFRRQQGSVRLLLSDVVLPGQNGPGLAKDLRDIRPRLKTIFMSGYPENIVTRYDLTANEVLYLPKPFSAESLLAKVRQVLQPA